MKQEILLITLSFVISVCSFSQNMWYETPADEWMKALPIGNGRLGAMIYGGVTTETIALNESSMWSGSVNPNQNIPFGRERLDSLRQMFFANKIAEGNSIAWNNLIGNEQDFGSHVPLGDIELMFLHPSGTTYTNYRRKLDLQKAQVRVNYSINNIRYTREYVCSHPQQVMAAHYTANRKNAISFDMGAKLLRPEATVRTEQNTLVITGKASQPGRTDKGVLFVVRLKVVAKDGEITTGDSILSVRNANEVTIYADLRTDYKQPDYLNLCRETTEKASARTFVSIQNEHETDYTPLFKRVSLTLGSNPEATKEPTDKRWMAVKKDVTMPTCRLFSSNTVDI